MRINTKYEAIIELNKFLKKVFANLRKACYYRRADKATRRYLSWIEGLTTNQYVGGSNPSRRTIETAGHRGFYLGGFFVFTGSFRPVGAIWVLSAAHRTLRSLSIAAALGL